MGRRIFVLAALSACGMGLVHVCEGRAALFRPARLHLAPGAVAALTATPGLISFQATNPNSGQVSGSSPGSLTWTVRDGSRLQNWTLSVQSGSSSFTGCPTIPVAAVRVSCGSASVSGGQGTGACSTSFPLSTSPQQIAWGAEGSGNRAYSVSINFTLAESWRYVANPACTIILTYFVNAP